MKYYTKYILLSFCFLIGMLHVDAQTMASPKKGGFLRIITGGSFPNIQAYNDALISKDYNRERNGFISLGAGYELWRKKFSIGMDGYLTVSKLQQRQVSPVSLDYSYGLVKIGYAIYQDGDYASIHPTIGFGWGQNTVRELDSRTRQFVDRKGNGILGEFAISGRRYYILEGEESTYHGELGLTIGYVLAPADQWNIQDFTNDSIGLFLPPSGFFFRITMGMGNWRKI